MASVSSSNKRASRKLSKRCFTLDEKIKILAKNKNRKMSRREIFEEINIGRTKAANVIAKDTRLRAGYENFQGKR